MKKIKPVIDKLKKYRKNKYFRARFLYTKLYDKIEIKDNYVLLQSYDGTSLSGNIYYILMELCKNKKYKNLKKYVVCTDKSKVYITNLLNKKNIVDVELIQIHSKKYCIKLLECKYLFNNSTFAPYFIKRENQIYINTWHGTPLKTLGRKIQNSPQELGNTQRNFMFADYLLYPNEFTFDHMREDYMLDNIFSGEYILSGYPRNTIFFDNNSRKNIRDELNLNDKKVIVYMPTWRGTLDRKDDDKQLIYTYHLLYELDKNLSDDTVVFVKLHNFNKKTLYFKNFTKIRPFPDEYETYEFLNISDCLITDYSSVFFDYANTLKKIILYCYDEEEYISERGMYLDYDKLPFPRVRNIVELLEELEDLSSYKIYQSFTKEYCNLDNAMVTKNLCSYIFDKKQSNLKIIDGKKYNNGKSNILIYGGAFYKNGITTSLKGLLNYVDKGKYNYFLSFYSNKVLSNRQTIREFKDICYMPMQGPKNMTFFEAIIHSLYFRFNITLKIFSRILDKVYKREIKRLYGNMEFKYAIHFTGYERHILKLFKNMDAVRIMFVHSDMYKEHKTRHNFSKSTYIECLKAYDKIAIVNESVRLGLKKIYSNIDEEKIYVVHNTNNIEYIRSQARKNINFDIDTYCNIEREELRKILNNKELIKFINIARFSPEKGLDRLITAFNKLENKETYLIIIGGHGILFNKIKQLVEDLGNERIILIKSLSNPLSILNGCDCLVLSSLYEGLPMTIMEALILNKSVISTDTDGVREFLKQGYGYLVPNSEEGIYQGMRDYLDGKVVNLKKFDAEKFNNDAMKEYEQLLKK